MSAALISSGHLSATDNATTVLEASGMNLNQFTYNILGGIKQSDLDTLDSLVFASKRLVKHGDTSDIPNWDMAAKELLMDCDIWFATEADISQPIEVLNRFTRAYEKYYIPDANYQEDKDVEYFDNPNCERRLQSLPTFLLSTHMVQDVLSSW